MVGLTDRQQKTSQPKPKASPLRKTTGPPLPTTSSTSGLARHNARTTFIPHARPAAHHEWSGGGQGPLIFFGNKGRRTVIRSRPNRGRRCGRSVNSPQTAPTSGYGASRPGEPHFVAKRDLLGRCRFFFTSFARPAFTRFSHGMMSGRLQIQNWPRGSSPRHFLSDLVC